MKILDFPKDKHKRYFEAVHWAAFSASGAGRNDFRLGAALVYKKNILTVRNNSGKTHPALVKFTEFPFLHSESNAILSIGMDNCSDCILYVIRILKNNDIVLSKPCCSCMKLIECVGIKKVYYSTNTGYEELVI